MTGMACVFIILSGLLWTQKKERHDGNTPSPYSRREVSTPSLTGCVGSVGCKATSELIGSSFFYWTLRSRNKTNSPSTPLQNRCAAMVGVGYLVRLVFPNYINQLPLNALFIRGWPVAWGVLAARTSFRSFTSLSPENSDPRVASEPPAR